MFSNKSRLKMEKSEPYTRYGQCRCCLANGNHRDITKEYYFNHIREVYSDIFMECFNLPLSTHKLLSTLICTKCVRRLRDAASFRMMVLNTEQQLLNEVSCENDQVPVFVDVPGPASMNPTQEIKTEFDSVNIDTEPDIFMECVVDGLYIDESSKTGELKGEDSKEYFQGDIEGGDFEGDTEGGDFEGDTDGGNSEADTEENKQDYDNCEVTKEEYVEEVDQVNLVHGEAGLLARFPTLEPLPTRHSLRRRLPKYVGHLDELEDKIVTPQSLEWFLENPISTDANTKRKSSKRKTQKQPSYVSEKLANALNATTLFEHSNATAFKTKNRNGYPCFYCREICNPEGLRTHQAEHSKSSLFKLFTKYTADELIVYADVTDLKCTICDEEIPSLADLKVHLTEVHNKTMFLDKPDRVIPFKLKDQDFECQVCGHYFETFGAVERHMNTHFGNFICEECGAGFITKHRLGVHSYVQHKHGHYVCNICNKYFSTPLKYRVHYDAVHKMLKKNKCPKCPEKFIDYFTRQKHLVDVHGDTPILYKCNVCDKAFNRKYTLSCHMKRTHLEQKDWKCEFCSYMCYTKTELRHHMVRHGANKEHECLICKRSYARKKALVMHMRIHTNDRRYSCSVCGMAFVQKSTLNGHMKTHR